MQGYDKKMLQWLVRYDLRQNHQCVVLQVLQLRCVNANAISVICYFVSVNDYVSLLLMQGYDKKMLQWLVRYDLRQNHQCVMPSFVPFWTQLAV